MAAWVVWLILAVLLGVAEVFTLTAVLGLLGGAALITSGVAAVGLPPAVQLLVFAVASTAGLLLVRPIAQRYMRGARSSSGSAWTRSSAAGRTPSPR